MNWSFPMRGLVNSVCKSAPRQRHKSLSINYTTRILSSIDFENTPPFSCRILTEHLLLLSEYNHLPQPQELSATSVESELHWPSFALDHRRLFVGCWRGRKRHNLCRLIEYSTTSLSRGARYSKPPIPMS